MFVCAAMATVRLTENAAHRVYMKGRKGQTILHSQGQAVLPVPTCLDTRSPAVHTDLHHGVATHRFAG